MFGNIIKASSIGVAALAMAGCVNETADIDQSRFCEVSTTSMDVVDKQCTPGEKVFFLPNRFGNEQLPVMFAGLYCDHRYTIAMTNGGVSCIYSAVDPKTLKEQSK